MTSRIRRPASNRDEEEDRFTSERVISCPSSAWARTSAKLRFARPRRCGCESSSWQTPKQSFGKVRTQAELGHEMKQSFGKVRTQAELGHERTGRKGSFLNG